MPTYKLRTILVISLFSAWLLSISGRSWGSPYFALVAFVPILCTLKVETSLIRGALASCTIALPMFLVGFEGMAMLSPLGFYGVALFLSSWFAIPGMLAVGLNRITGYRHDGYVGLIGFMITWLTVETLSGSYNVWTNWANPISLGLSQVDSVLLKLAFWSGISTVSAATLICNLAIFSILNQKWKSASLMVVLVAALVLVTGRVLELSNQTAGEHRQFRVGIIQGALTEVDLVAASFSVADQERLVGEYVSLTELLMKEVNDIDVVLWPENAASFYASYGAHISTDVFPKEVTVLAGGYDYQPSDNRQFYNSIMFWDGFSHSFVYDKQALVPMYEDWLRSGRGYREGLPVVGDLRLGLGICWESLYAEMSRYAVGQGADILVYLSDATFANGTVTPWYHLRSSAARAIESGRFVVFASQSGPSGVVSPTGEWKIVTKPEAGFWHVDIPISGRAVITPFIRFGNWLGWLCSLAALAIVCWCWRVSRNLVYAG